VPAEEEGDIQVSKEF
jgi:hypothetical protein